MTTANILIERTFSDTDKTILYSDGTKIRHGDMLRYESMDLKVTDFCDLGCKYCHEESTTKGKHADLENVKSIFSKEKYKDVLEIAIGGGNPLDWPHLEEFVDWCNGKYVANVTINQLHFQKYLRNNPEKLKILDKFKGIGVSVRTADTISTVLDYHPHTVAHVIAGVNSFKEIESVVEASKRTLILGYKTHGRGILFKNAKVEHNIYGIRTNLRKLFDHKDKVIAFDNLGIEQLSPERFFPDQWDEMYMGNDGEYSCYIDAVAMKQYRSSFDRQVGIEL